MKDNHLRSLTFSKKEKERILDNAVKKVNGATWSDEFEMAIIDETMRAIQKKVKR